MNIKIINIILSSFLLGAILGILIGISIKYPLNPEYYEKAQKICESHENLKRLNISITGKVHSVECKDSSKFYIK
jgi:hypothetical protein